MSHFCTIVITTPDTTDAELENILGKYDIDPDAATFYGGVTEFVEDEDEDFDPIEGANGYWSAPYGEFDYYTFGGTFADEWNYQVSDPYKPGTPIDICDIKLPINYILTAAEEAEFLNYYNNYKKQNTPAQGDLHEYQVLRDQYIRLYCCHEPYAFIGLDGEFDSSSDFFSYIELMQQAGRGQCFFHVVDMHL